MPPEPEKKLLIIGHNWPEPSTTAAGQRMLQLLEAFAEKGFRIFYGSTASKTEYSSDLSPFGVAEVTIKLNDSGFDRLVKQLRPDLVIFDRFMVEEQFGWRVAENAPDALLILNTEDLHSLRHYRETAVKKQEPFDTGHWLASAMAKREMASIFRSDLSLVVSDVERQLLVYRVGVPQTHILHLPFMLPPLSKDKINDWTLFRARSGFVCFGNGRHAPNIDAIVRLKTALWPNLRKQLPQAILSVYGAYLPQHIQQFHNETEGFLVKGWVDDLDAVLQKARVNLAPLRFGAGIKGKFIDAMQNGLPSVTTPIGAEGMHDRLPWAGHIAKNDEDFIKVAVQLYNDKEQWQLAQQNGVAIINKLYAAKNLKAVLFDTLAALTSDLAGHRAQNFIGQLLRHQSLAATKYMGKWIEEKNKRD